MTTNATITSMSSGIQASFVPVLGSSYGLTQVPNFTPTSAVLGGATVTGNNSFGGTTITSEPFLVYNDPIKGWIVHGQDDAGNYCTFTINAPTVTPVIGGAGSGALSNVGPLGFGTLGEEIALGIGILVLCLLIMAFLRHRK